MQNNYILNIFTAILTHFDKKSELSENFAMLIPEWMYWKVIKVLFKKIQIQDDIIWKVCKINVKHATRARDFCKTNRSRDMTKPAK